MRLIVTLTGETTSGRQTDLYTLAIDATYKKPLGVWVAKSAVSDAAAEATTMAEAAMLCAARAIDGQP